MMIRYLGMLALLSALALVACGRAAPAATPANASALASPSPVAHPTALPTSTTVRPTVSRSLLPPTVAPTPPLSEAIPAGLSGAIAYVDSTCALVTLDLAVGGRSVQSLPPTETALDAPPCIISEAAARVLAGAPTVTPASAALPQGGLRARSGEEAWVEPFTEDALLHVRDPATGDERTYPLNLNGSSDRIFGLIAYVAEDSRLLGGYTPGSGSSGMLLGPSLMLLDPHTGTRQELGIMAHQRPETIAFNPTESELVAIVSSSVRRDELPPECGLLTLDAATAAMRCLADAPADTPLWSPDGATLAYATHGGAIALAATADLAAPPRLLLTGGAQTGLLAWLSPGQLLYVTYPAPPARLRGELYILDTSTGQRVLIAHDVGEPRCYAMCMYRSLVVFYQPRQGTATPAAALYRAAEGLRLPHPRAASAATWPARAVVEAMIYLRAVSSIPCRRHAG